jgi:calcineurin-like phosphoesterase family protein
MAIFFTSDNHFNHQNIIWYSRRPFKTVEEMNQTMIDRWNKVVTPEDTVYHLGDFGFGSHNRLRPLREQLNGRMILIKGNHDHRVHRWLMATDEYYESLTIGKRVWLTHIPPIFIPGKKQPPTEAPVDATLCLCGHAHERWPTRVNDDGLTILNVGVDVCKFRPVTPKELGIERWVE